MNADDPIGTPVLGADAAALLGYLAGREGVWLDEIGELLADEIDLDRALGELARCGLVSISPPSRRHRCGIVAAVPRAVLALLNGIDDGRAA